MGFVLSILAVAAAAYGAFGLFLYFREKRRQYAPTHRDAEGRGNKVFQSWRNPAGEFLGYYRPNPKPRRIVVFFHGNGGEALDRAWAEELVPPQDLLILAEYPGFGARAGRITRDALLFDAQRIVEEAQARWGKLPVVAVGEGLGASISSYLASQRKVDRLALISPFASEEVVSKGLQFYPAKWLRLDHYPTLEYLRTAQAPLHVVHGTLDEFVPLEHGRAVYQAYPGTSKALDEVPGCGHANLGQALLHSPFTTRFRQFIAD